MQSKAILLVSLCTWFVMGTMGCDREPTKPSNRTGHIIVHLTDAPARFDAVNITFSEISAHIDSDWVNVELESDSTVNLLDYANGKTLVLAQGDVPAGHYTQIRLKIKSAQIAIDGLTYPLDVPSGAQSGLKFRLNLDVQPGSSYELVIDFDANRSILVTGPKNNLASYKLKPCIRVLSKAMTGSITGTVSNARDLPVAYAIQSADTITSTMTDPDNGRFLLAFLPEGNYTVSLRDTLGRAFSKDFVLVSPGKSFDLGIITLQ
ncbi:MAG: DUF4382 domain-containing protein [candidate division KSB1 bacterium]|nr:DUF4382 domain-containing protein [candidate division KSB1 bacterium]MDZ7358536.1 DUF4382 domain-containing protein [candidate division KSB1 bacterium]MDZ7375646.1 DUF4382 domain-containing protein [candidate division KSB1 bacterium]MDZ7402218.1 DUF4382 domain-containing protein [candidate division KSB1 bacterium]